MKSYSLIFGLILTSLVGACGQQTAPGKTSIDTAATIRANVDKFMSAWNKGDTASYGAFIAPDAVLMGQNEPLVNGRDAIVARMAKDFDTTKAQQTATVDEVISMGDHAYARGTWTINPTAGAGGDMKPMSGKWSILYQRGGDGTWLTSRWMWNMDTAPNPGG